MSPDPPRDSYPRRSYLMLAIWPENARIPGAPVSVSSPASDGSSVESDHVIERSSPSRSPVTASVPTTVTVPVSTSS